MKKEYVCTIDGMTFSTEQALIQHFLSHHSLIQAPGANHAVIIKDLQEAFPTAHIEFTSTDFQGQPAAHLDLVFPEYGDAHFAFMLSSSKQDGYSGERVFKDVGDAIQHYERLFEEKEKLVIAIMDHFQIANVDIRQICESSPYEDGVASISFSFEVNGNLHHGNYNFEGIDRCIRRLEGRFVTSVEGEVDLDYGKYNSEDTIFVDGVDLCDIARRAKRLKVEIIE